MIRAVLRWAMKRVAVVAAGVFALGCALVLAYVLCLVLYLVFPTHVGPHHAFFKACEAIPEGASVSGVLERMRGATFVRGQETRPVDGALRAAYPLPTLDSYGRDPSFLFYPNPQDTDDWCVVYFRQHQVVRTEVFPTHGERHRAFFETCVAIPEKASIPEVLERMQGSAFVRRFGYPRVTDALLASPPRLAPGRNGESSFLFYPNARDIADWCVVYFRQDRVVRTEIDPD
jgi:hypothetical protein